MTTTVSKADILRPPEKRQGAVLVFSGRACQVPVKNRRQCPGRLPGGGGIPPRLYRDKYIVSVAKHLTLGTF